MLGVSGGGGCNPWAEIGSAQTVFFFFSKCVILELNSGPHSYKASTSGLSYLPRPLWTLIKYKRQLIIFKHSPSNDNKDKL